MNTGKSDYIAYLYTNKEFLEHKQYIMSLEQEYEDKYKGLPLTPEHLKQNVVIPDTVINIINKLLEDNFKGVFPIIINRETIAKAILKRYKEINKNQFKTIEDVYDSGFMDFENLYNKWGWNVKLTELKESNKFYSFNKK
jgi:hypothetical protein